MTVSLCPAMRHCPGDATHPQLTFHFPLSPSPPDTGSDSKPHVMPPGSPISKETLGDKVVGLGPVSPESQR